MSPAQPGAPVSPVPPPRILAVPTDPASLLAAIEAARKDKAWSRLAANHPIAWYWLLEDLPGRNPAERLGRLAEKGLDPDAWASMTAQASVGADPASIQSAGPGADAWLAACRARRTRRLAACPPRLVYTRHTNIGSHFGAGWTHYAFNEALSESTAWQVEWVPGSELCLLTIDSNGTATTTSLLADPTGMIRDPEVSYDASRILFAWKRGAPGRNGHTLDDYHLYEMTVATGAIRQLTNEKGVADYEPCYLPGGDIIFNSSRCVQMVDCWSTPVSNLYRCDADGGNIRRLTYDQVHDNHPRVLGDGRIVYTRWEYNDRGQIFPQPLFVMRPDGTAQAALYGGNSWFPTSLLHPRPLPGSSALVAIASGHHTGQVGKLVEVDPNRGAEEAEGITYLAPRRPAKAERSDYLGQQGEIFSHPWPVDRQTFIAGYAGAQVSGNWKRRMDLCLVTATGAVELLATDPRTSCNQPMPLAPRGRPPIIPDSAGSAATTGICYLQDVHSGPGLAGIPRGTVKRLRVVALDYRAAGIGRGENNGPAGSSAVCTPVSLNSGSWDVKRVLGEVDLGEDGSACFEVPARVPIFFQALDAKGHVIQTMRSWTTLQGGETQGCVGCHETKAQTPRAYEARLPRPQTLRPGPGGGEGFSFQRQIQPILDRHCISCHNDTARQPEGYRDGQAAVTDPAPPAQRAFSLLGVLRKPKGKGVESTRRQWSDAYLALTGAATGWGPLPAPKALRGNAAGTALVNWISAQSVPTLLPPYTAGAHSSGLLKLLDAGHHDVALSREERDRIACWIDLCVPFCGDYREANAWNDQEMAIYERALNRREQLNPR